MKGATSWVNRHLQILYMHIGAVAVTAHDKVALLVR